MDGVVLDVQHQRQCQVVQRAGSHVMTAAAAAAATAAGVLRHLDLYINIHGSTKIK